ncbi:MAG: glycosyltransferase [Hydrogenophilales bacterium]|nr:glycosyltransferase [Hydrogenophilales bacterium]
MRAASFAVGGLLLVGRTTFDAVGGYRPAMDGIEQFDFCLRLYEHGGECAIGHVPELLYHRYSWGGHSTRSLEEIEQARLGALAEHLDRIGQPARIEEGYIGGTYHLRHIHEARPLVSIIIPTKNQCEFLERCISTLLAKTLYANYEVLVVDNGSTETAALDYLSRLDSVDERIRVIAYPGLFNFSAMNNRAAEEARGEYLLLLNNDTAILHDDWLDEMLSHGQRSDVGVVGARLIYPSGKVQHAGVILGLNNTPAEHIYIGADLDDLGYFGRLQLTQDVSAVSGACLLVRKLVYDQLGGLDETNFQVSYNDIDLCLKVRQVGLLVVWTPFATLLHEGSASQLANTEQTQQTEKQRRFLAERGTFYDKWPRQIAFDPAYNRNFSLRTRRPEIEAEPMLRLAPSDRNRPRILAHTGDRAGSGEYRVMAPMRQLNRAGRVYGLETDRYLGIPELLRFEPDSIVLQRQIEPRNIERIEGYRRHGKAFTVFELDDLLFNPPVRHVASAQIASLPELKKRLRKAIGLCDRLMVSTDYLADAMREYATEIVVCPNYIEAARWCGLTLKRQRGAKPRVGWAGSFGHEGDLEIIVDVVKATASQAEWVFLGYCPESLKGHVEFQPIVALADYPAKLASLDLDLAVAPLEDVPFNHAKSHLRLLEYGILGYPVICSDITPYRGDYPVHRVRNRHKDWLEAIHDMLTNSIRLAQAGDALRAHVEEHWLLENNLDRWQAAWLPK